MIQQHRMFSASPGTGRRIARMVFISFLIAGAAIQLRAGRPDKAGASAAPELLIPVGARSIALGGSSLATVSGIEALYWNPAGLDRSAHGANAMFSHMSYMANIGVEYVAVSNSFAGLGTLGF